MSRPRTTAECELIAIEFLCSHLPKEHVFTDAERREIRRVASEIERRGNTYH